MNSPEQDRLNYWGQTFLEYQKPLLKLASRNLNPILQRRFSPEDVLQETFQDALRKLDFFENNPECPIYMKLRKLLFQKIADLERRHCQTQKRDAFRDVGAADFGGTSSSQLDWNRLADSMTGPLTRLARMDRNDLLQKAIASLSETDRQILEMRHFDDMSNQECAEALKIEPKAASIRYVRALQRLQKLLLEYSDFTS